MSYYVYMKHSLTSPLCKTCEASGLSLVYNLPVFCLEIVLAVGGRTAQLYLASHSPYLVISLVWLSTFLFTILLCFFQSLFYCFYLIEVYLAVSLPGCFPYYFLAFMFSLHQTAKQRHNIESCTCLHDNNSKLANKPLYPSESTLVSWNAVNTGKSTRKY